MCSEKAGMLAWAKYESDGSSGQSHLRVGQFVFGAAVIMKCARVTGRELCGLNGRVDAADQALITLRESMRQSQ